MTILERIRDFHHELRCAHSASAVQEIKVYVLTPYEMRELLREIDPWMVGKPSDVMFLPDDKLRERVNAGGFTCYGIPINVE